MRQWTSEDVDAAKELLGRCRSVADAAAIIGTTGDALQKAFRRHGANPPFAYVGRGTTGQQIATSADVPDRGAIPPPRFERRFGDEFPSPVNVEQYIKPTDPAFNGGGDGGLASSRCWLVLPDLHGRLMDRAAAEAALDIVSILKPCGIVQLGDLMDLSGFWSTHTPSYIKEAEYSLFGDGGDAACAKWFLDELQRRAPGAWIKILQGNHCLRIEKTLARMAMSATDAKALERMLAPDVLLDFRGRGIQFARMDEFYDGLSIPGALKIGPCHVVHGISAATHAAAVHLARFGASVIFGHTHRAMSLWSRTIARGLMFSGSPGTLSILQPLYMHTSPTTWSQGVMPVFEDGDEVLPVHVPIVNGKHMLREMLGMVRPSALVGRAA